MAGGTVSKENPQDGMSFLPWLLGKEKKFNLPQKKFF